MTTNETTPSPGTPVLVQTNIDLHPWEATVIYVSHVRPADYWICPECDDVEQMADDTATAAQCVGPWYMVVHAAGATPNAGTWVAAHDLTSTAYVCEHAAAIATSPCCGAIRSLMRAHGIDGATFQAAVQGWETTYTEPCNDPSCTEVHHAPGCDDDDCTGCEFRWTTP